MTLGRRIWKARKRLGLSQGEIGEAFGISSQAVSQWEADKEIPELRRLSTLRKILKVNYSWLMDGGDTPPPDPHSFEVLIENLGPVEQAAIRTGQRAMMDVLRQQDRSA